MNKRLLSLGVLFLVVSACAVFIMTQHRNDSTRSSSTNSAPTNQAGVTDETNGIVLYYGDGCPHCATVEQFITANNIATKVRFEKKEVYDNTQNADELASKAKACGLPTDSIGVPFLWDGFACFMGDEDIIEFFTLQTHR